MTDQKKVDIALGKGQSGVTLKDAVKAKILAASQGGAPMAAFFREQDSHAGFMSSLSDDGAWIWSKDTQGHPVVFAAQQSKDNKLTMVLRPNLVLPPNLAAADVGSDMTDAGTFEYDGKTYNIVGSISATFEYNETPVWAVTIPLGVTALIPIWEYGKMAWAGLLKPVLTGFWAAFKGMCSSAAEAIGGVLAAGGDTVASETATDAADQAAEDVGVEVGLKVGAAAFSAMIVLMAIPFIVQGIGHTTRQRLKIYNLTPYDITWSKPEMKHGAMNLAPVTTAGGDEFDPEIPAMSEFSPGEGIEPVLAAHDANFAFVSRSEYTGVGWVMGFDFSDPSAADGEKGKSLLSAAAAFWVPWGAANTLNGAFVKAITEDTLSDVWKNATSSELTFGVLMGLDRKMVKMALSYDFLDGKHPDPSGLDAYFYTSMIVFSMA